MRRRPIHSVAFLVALLASACTGTDPVAPELAADLAPPVRASAPSAEAACWGQASKVFALLGQTGEHSSQESNPRAGLRNLARELYRMGVISDDTMVALGQFVAAAEGYSIEACMT